MTKILKRSKRFISLLLLSVMILSLGVPGVFAQAVSAPDIESHWAKNEISSWMGQGFITGYPDGTFKPNNTITRAEFISIVNRLFAFSEKATVPFSDVKESDWFHAEFAKAAKAGYLNGYKGTVDPNGFISRQEVAAIAAKVKFLPDSAADASGFADAAMILDGYKGAVGAVVKAKVMNGYPNGKFEPTNRITRAEAVVTLNRLINLKTGAVKIEAVKDQKAYVGLITTVALKLLPEDAKLTIQNSDAAVVEATLNGTSLQLKGKKVGTAALTVTGKKDNMEDGVVTFKVEVVAAPASSGGGGGGGGGSTTPKPDENALTAGKAVVGTTTEVTGIYKSSVKKVEVTYNGVSYPVEMANGTYSCSIIPGLSIGTKIVVNAYVGNTLVDTDEITVIEDDTMLTAVEVKGTTATEVSGNFAAGVTKVEVIYGNITKAAVMNDGSFYWNIFPGLEAGTAVTVKGYIGNLLVDTDVVTLGTPTEGPYLSNVKAVGKTATAVTGTYGIGVTKVEVLYNSLAKIATLNPDKTFSWSIFPGLAGGTTVTVKAYVGSVLKETVTVVTEGGSTEEPYLSNVKAIGTTATAVTGSYAAGVTKVEVLYNDLTKTAILNPDKTFSWSIFPGLAGGTTVTVKAYVGSVLKETVTIVTEGGPVEGPYITEAKAIGTTATAVTGKYADVVTKVEVLYNNLTKTAILNPDKTFSWSIFPGLASGTQVTVKAYVGEVLKETVAVNVQ